MEIYELTLKQLCDGLAQKQFTAAEVVQAYQARIQQVEPQVHGYLHTLTEQAFQQAQQADERRAKGDASLLLGVPYAIKDNLCTDGVATTCASRMLEHFVPPYNATVVEKLNQHGLISLGKANMDEFAMGSSTENSAFIATCNPHDLSRVPGGSSGGSAAIVASGMAPFALGSDTGGSVRQPAALCGVVGFKPTYGMVSRYGLVAFGSSLDQVGVLSRSVEDCAMVMQIIAGHDPHDSTSLPQPAPDFTASLEAPLKGLKIGLPQEYFAQGVSDRVRQRVEEAAQTYAQLGATVERCSLPLAPYSLPTYYLLACAEASSNLARYDGVRYGYRAKDAANWSDMMTQTRTEAFGAEVKRRIMLGTFVLSAGYYDAYYKKAQQARVLIKRDFAAAFAKYDLLLTPTSPTTAWKLGEKADPLSLYAADVCTVAVNIAGLPALSLPCGTDEAGLPVGMQLIGNACDDARVLAAGHAYQKACGTVIAPVCQGGAK